MKSRKDKTVFLLTFGIFSFSPCLQIAESERRKAPNWSRSTAPLQNISYPAAKSAPWCPSSHRTKTGRFEMTDAWPPLFRRWHNLRVRLSGQKWSSCLCDVINSPCNAWRSWPWVAGTLRLETGRCTATSCTSTLWRWRSAMWASRPQHEASTSISESASQVS